MPRPFRHSLFFVIHLTFLVVGLYFLVSVPKGDFFLFINQHHQPGFDFFFRYITHLGDGLVLVGLLVVLLFYRYSFAIISLVTIAVQALLMLLLKQGLFHGMPRPKAWFPDNTLLHFVDGVEIHSYNTFPSGHTATAFALFGLLAWLFAEKRQLLSVLCFILAAAVGFSRIYLGQHFLVDVYFGSIVGITSIMTAIPLSNLIFKRADGKWRSGSLMDHFRSSN